MSQTQEQTIALRAAGLRNAEIARQLGIAPTYVSFLLRGSGIPLPKKAQQPTSDRAKAMASAYRSGKTLQAIGDEYGVSRERVRQLIQPIGISAKKGGRHVMTAKKAAALAVKKDESALRRFGCTRAQYRWLLSKNGENTYCRSPLGAFTNQKNNAKQRGIPWNLKLWDWWLIWQESGKWNERGRGFGYVMARLGDSGAYERGNVRIITSVENIKESYINRPAATRKKPGRPGGVGPTVKQREAMGLRNQGLSYTEIAERMHIKVPSAMNHVSLARRHDKRNIGQEHYPE